MHSLCVGSSFRFYLLPLTCTALVFLTHCSEHCRVAEGRAILLSDGNLPGASPAAQGCRVGGLGGRHPSLAGQVGRQDGGEFAPCKHRDGVVLRREARAGVALVDSKLCFSWQGCWGHTVPSLCPHVLIELLILGRHRSDPSRFAWPPRWERITKPRDRLHLARRGQSSVHFAASGSWGRKFSPCKYFHPSLDFFFFPTTLLLGRNG